MTSRKAAQQAALFARFGVPQQLPADVVDESGVKVVRVYAVGCEEAARAFVAAERETWGNRAWSEVRPEVGWVVVVDLRSQVAAHLRAHPLPRIRG